MHMCVQAGGLLADRWRGAPPSAARLDTLAKAKYGSQLREGGGWPWLQDMLQVCGHAAVCVCI